MLKLERILVPVDFSPASRSALDAALTMAERFGASVEAIHVLEYPVYTMPEMNVAIAGSAPLAFEAFARQRAEQSMIELMAPFSSRGSIGTRVVEGEAKRTIVDYAKEGRFDLIVMGTHGRTGLDHMLLGSVAERVVRKAPCAVLTIREVSKS